MLTYRAVLSYPKWEKKLIKHISSLKRITCRMHNKPVIAILTHFKILVSKL